MQQLTPQERNMILAEVEKRLEQESNKPFIISIMGQTGVGKSSLINALFNTTLKTDPVRPTTKDVEPVSVKGANGHMLVFNDMPGIGESEKADVGYIRMYRQYLLDSDVVIWAVHADNRSTAFDVQALQYLLKDMDPKQQSLLMSRITFVLTKADVLTPSPWILGDMGSYAIFTPGKTTKELLAKKEVFYQETFIKPFGANIISWTYNDVKFVLNNPSFTYTDYSIYYQGLLTVEAVMSLKQNHPLYVKVFDRLYDNYRVIPCSSLFRYNLTEVLLVILNKLGSNAVERFKQFVNSDYLEHVPLERGRKMCNITIYDMQNRRKVFDLGNNIFPNTRGNGSLH